MAEETSAAPAAAAAIPMPAAPDDAASRPISVDQAAKAMSDWRSKQEQPVEKPRAPDGKFAAAQESPLEGADAAAETPSGEEEGAEVAEEPPIEPPHSWTKAEKERFASLPRETQSYLAERESARDAELNRRQNEAAEKSKALEAKEQAAETARQQYESAAQNALALLQQQQASEFGDIKTHADVNKLATEDPFRFAQWQARQMQIAAQHQEVENLNRQRKEQQDNTFKAWSKEQDDKFAKQFPEFGDPEKGAKITASLQSYLTKTVGVPEEALPELKNNSLFRDAMFQRVLYDASRFHAAQQAAKSAVPASKPQVQRPGVAAQRGSQNAEAITAAQDRLKNSRGNNAALAAAELMAAKRKAAR